MKQPLDSLKSHIRRFPMLVRFKKTIWRHFDGSRITLDLINAFPLFTSFSSGNFKARTQLTIQTINQTMPFMASLAKSLGCRSVKSLPLADFSIAKEDLEASHELKGYLDNYGSDKANNHNYHNLYGPILKDRENVTGIFEVGLGTNNTEVVSNMGKCGKPGASLRAFRDFAKNALVFGADVDERILFEDQRIRTFHLDQTDLESFATLGKQIPSELDLVIDDGLHAPNANLATLQFGLTKIKVGGWVVIEDISTHALPLWEIVAALLPMKFEPLILTDTRGNIFAVRRVS